MSTLNTVQNLKDNGEDFEFYPTTVEIIGGVLHDLEANKGYSQTFRSVLDIGAGDGRVVKEIGNKFGMTKNGIEKSSILKGAWDKDIVPIGSDFNEITLIDKEHTVIFCNPPYKEFKQWTVKILEEANFEYLYLVIPDRWEKDEQIQEVIEERAFKYKVIGEYDFLDADRKARANVHLIRFRKKINTEDAFTYFYKKHFEKPKEPGPVEEEEVQDTREVVSGADFVQKLVSLYDADVAKLMQNIQTLSEVDAKILEMVGIKKRDIIQTLRDRVHTLKRAYWERLFARLDKITERLTKKSRDKMLSQMNQHAIVDFNTSNIYDVVIWIIKNANDYIDEQIVDVYLSLFSEKNITNYKSNSNAFSKWRYEKDIRSLYGLRAVLDYQIVVSGWNAIYQGDFYRSNYTNNLHESSHTKINDLITIANNLGFTIDGNSYDLGEWESGKKKYLYLKSSGKLEVGAQTNVGKIKEVYYHKDDYYTQYLIGDVWYHENNVRAVGDIMIEVKAFKNGNVHFKLNTKFIKALNLKAAALLGWVRDKEDFERETGIKVTAEEESAYLNKEKAIKLDSMALLSAKSEI